MKKFCIFCGKHPESKTMEHVIPRWLLKHTGDPNRVTSLGIDWNVWKPRTYSFSSLKFPACDFCNNQFAKNEAQAKDVVISMLDEQNLSSQAFSTLLSWFDKIRIGLWLGFILLNKNMSNIDPHFYIQERMDVADRILLIYKVDDKKRGILFMGVDNPFFNLYPSCFGFTINQFYFINISTDFLFSRRLGLPYPTKKSYVKGKKLNISFNVVDGLKRKLLPLLRKDFDKTCTEIYQPIIRPEIINFQNFKTKFYENKYINGYFDINNSLLGKILIYYQKDIIDYSTIPQNKWIPMTIHERVKITKLVASQVLSFQNWLLTDLPDFDYVTPSDKKSIKSNFAKIKKINNILLDIIKNKFLRE